MGGLATGVVGAIRSMDWGGALAAAGSALAALRDGLAAALGRIDWGGALTAGGWASALAGGIVSTLQSIDWGGALASVLAQMNEVIAEVLQTGYLLDGRPVRHAMVKVTKK